MYNLLNLHNEPLRWAPSLLALQVLSFSTYIYSPADFIYPYSFKYYLHAEPTSLFIPPDQAFPSELDIHASHHLGCIRGFSNLANQTSFYPYSTKLSLQRFPSQLTLPPSPCSIRPKICELSMILFSFPMSNPLPKPTSSIFKNIFSYISLLTGLLLLSSPHFSSLLIQKPVIL